MPVDKDNGPAIKAMIKTTYAPVLQRTLLGFIMKDLAEIAASMKITTKAKLTPQQRVMLIEEQLQSNGIKKTLLVRLNALRHLRHAIATEVIEQYDLRLANDEISFYYDVMEEILENYELQVQEWIVGGAYDEMHRALSSPQVH